MATPFGTLPAVSRADGRLLPDGTAAQILIRPEALRCGDDAARFLGGRSLPTLARVTAARPLGYACLLHLAASDPESGAVVVLRARTPGQELPEEGAGLAVALDPAQAFIFAAD